jgi:acetyl esterase/lipase
MHMLKIILINCLVFLLLPNAFCAESFKPDKTLVYKDIGSHKLQLYIFNPANHRVNDSSPAIIFFFGGGWRVGSPKQFFPHCRYLASRGMVAISAEYRIKNKHGTTPFECVKDGKSAIRWVRTHSTKLGIDTKRIAAGGASAGGQVAAAAGTVKGFEEPKENLKISSKPNALVLIYPVIDNGPGGYGYDRVRKRWKEFSPMHNIDQSTPPTTIFLGTRDSYIPVSTAIKYKSLMDDAGVRCDLHLYDGQPHGFCNHPSFKGNSTVYFEKVCIEIDRFLISLGYLKKNPTL